MNKFEQVCSDGHQMSQAGGLGLQGVPYLMSGWGGVGWGVEGALYSEVQCIICNGHTGIPVKTLTCRNFVFNDTHVIILKSFFFQTLHTLLKVLGIGS